MESLKIEELKRGLAQASGTEQYHRLTILPVNCTDGVRFLAEKAEAFWLLDAITSYRRTEPFQVWTLKVNADKTAVLEMREDSDAPILITQEFKHTDFPLSEITLYLIDGVLLLPSEY